AIDQIVDQLPEIESAATDGFEEWRLLAEDQPHLPKEDRLDDVRCRERRARKMRREDEDPGVGEGEEVDDVRIESGAHVEDHVVGIERVDGGDQLQFVSGAEVRDLLDEVQRSGDESKIAVLAFRIEVRTEVGDAVVERLVAAEEVIEIALDRRVDGVAD